MVVDWISSSIRHGCCLLLCSQNFGVIIDGLKDTFGFGLPLYVYL
jgi:hypothetical protein